MKTYKVENRENNQDGINFIDVVNAKNEMPSFLDYEEVLEFSLKNGNIENENSIKSICDGGDHVQPYFSENTAAFECECYVENTSFEVKNEEGEFETKTLKFDANIFEYELF
jgi:hypothetical protein